MNTTANMEAILHDFVNFATNPNFLIFATSCRIPLVLLTLAIWPNILTLAIWPNILTLAIWPNRSQILLSNPYIFATLWRKPLLFQTLIIWPNIIQSLKYQRFATSGCNDIWIKFVFVIIIQLLFEILEINEVIRKLDLVLNLLSFKSIFFIVLIIPEGMI